MGFGPHRYGDLDRREARRCACARRPLHEAAHAGFEGVDLCAEAQPAQRFDGSIPLDQAPRPEVLLAWAMNGEPLPPSTARRCE